MCDTRKMMNRIIDEINTDAESGLSRFLQANPYTRFPFYTYDDSITPELFENVLYCESKNSERYKNYLISILDKPHGKNTFFIVGYQGCGKTTFIHSVVNEYLKKEEFQLIDIDCDKKGIGQSVSKIHTIFSMRLEEEIDSTENFNNFVDFFESNIKIFRLLPNKRNLTAFYKLIKECNSINKTSENFDIDTSSRIEEFIEKQLNTEDIFNLLVLWFLSKNYDNCNKVEEKLIVIIDNLDYVDAYDDLVVFINTLDALTVNFSDKFSKIKLCKTSDISLQYTEKIKLFVAMRETTKASLPTSHFSDAFQTIYKSNDITECYDKSEIIRKRIHELKKYDQNLLIPEVIKRLDIILKITEDSYTQNVIYPLFNNNYRSAISLLSKIVMEHYDILKSYNNIMDIPDRTFRHGARGILFKLIFDEFNKNDGNDESCLKKIGVLNLLNRNNNDVSICRLLLSYLSNYTETKCDSARNSVTLSDIIKHFKTIFDKEDILSTLCAMFELRDTCWTHLVSFNQIIYCQEASVKSELGKIDFKNLDTDQTMIHYSCAGKIYIEFVTTHFEFFVTRVFKDSIKPLFHQSNIKKDLTTGKYMFQVIIDKIFDEVVQCCLSLEKFNVKTCSENNYENPYKDHNMYKNSHYVCQFKRKEYDTDEERRFKHFHEDRMITSHIVYLDKYRIYVLNYLNDFEDEAKKKEINKIMVECINKYVCLLQESYVLVTEHTQNTLIPHYKERIKFLVDNPTDFQTEISYNN